MMGKLAAVALGGSLGAAARYVLATAMDRLGAGTFPLGTLSVNLIGSFVAGVVWGVCESLVVPPTVRIFVMVGILGGFTTFSAFSVETMNLVRDGQVARAASNMMLNNAGALVLVFAGLIIARALCAHIR